MTCLKLARRRLAVACLAAVAGILASCSPDRPRLDGTGDDQGNFTLGPATAYPVVNGGAVTDSISGGVFAFPEGGSGTLSVARIEQSPLPVPEDARAFHVEFTGSDPMEIRLERTAQSIPVLYIYGFGDVSPSDPMKTENTWWGIMPEDTVSNPAVFQLAPPGRPEPGSVTRPSGAEGEGTSVTAAGTPAGRPVNSYHCVVQLAPPDCDMMLFRRIRKKATELTIQDVIAGLPERLRQHAWSETEGRLALQCYDLMFAFDVSAYSAFTYPLGNFGIRYRRLYPMMHYVWSGRNAADEYTIAHEVGHYMTHVFFGDDAFEAFSDGQLIRDHDIGYVHPRRDMLEEYAMYVDYFINDRISGGADVTEPIPLLQRSPRVEDFPKVEGYATALMARMTTETDSIVDLDALKEDIPVIAASFNDVFGILYEQKPTTVDELRSDLADYLAGRQIADRLPVIMERTGWSYNGQGKVVDKDGKGVGGAKVQSVYRVSSENGREYLAPVVPVVTANDGSFTLPRIFPATGSIRVKLDQAEQDFPFPVDPDDHTNESKKIGTLKLESDAITHQLRRTEFIDVEFEGDILFSDGTHQWSLVLTTVSDSLELPSWNGMTCTQRYSFGSASGGMSVDLVARFAPSGRRIDSLDVTIEERWSYLRVLRHVVVKKVEASDVWGDEIIFTREGADLRDDLRMSEEYQPTGQGTRTISSIDWDSQESPPSIRITFSQPDDGGGRGRLRRATTASSGPLRVR